ncbi:MAG: hypothetical protein LBB81_11040 [Treponema sp.]|jgi:hypothetical protein|nr:hypothetical protein [Treponema sp.]
MRRLTPEQKASFDELFSKTDEVDVKWEAANASRNAQGALENTQTGNDASRGQPQNPSQTAVQVQHEGEYVLTSEGGRDFGKISAETGQEIQRQAGPVRLRIGEQDKKTGKGYGEKHIERSKRIKQLKGIGFNSARDFVQFVAQNYDSIYEADGGALHIVNHGEHDTLLVIKLEPSESGDFYDVKTGFVARKGYIKEKPLWERTQGGLLSDQERANTNQQQVLPNADSGRSDNTNIPQTTGNVNNNTEKHADSVDASGVPAIRERYEAAEKIYGENDTVNKNGREFHGRYVIMEADIPVASHNEKTFHETEGFPTVNGKNMNTRDYYHDRAAQEAVIEASSSYDSRALEEIPIITTDSLTVDGNQRIMTGKLAAEKNTDGKYLDSFPKKAKLRGFTAEQIQQAQKQFKHPRLLFEIEIEKYDAALFDLFNQSTKKATDQVETAVKMAKLLANKESTVKSIAAAIKEHESVDELYKDKKALQEIFNTLKTDRLIGEYDMPQYFTEQGGITGAGEDLLENALLGATLKEDNIRVLSESKNLRRKLARALPYLIENRAMGEYSVIPQVNEAVRIAADVEKNSKTWKNVEEWAAQSGFDFMEQKNQIAVELAKQLEGKTQSGFADMMGGLNAVLADAASGQSDLLAEGIESKENIIRRYLGIKAEIEKVKSANNKIIKDESAPMVERVQAAVDNAGIAKKETLFQIIGRQGAAALDNANKATTLTENLIVARQMEEAGKDAKAVRMATGWERGADGKWRYEIPDITVTFIDAFERLADGKEESSDGKWIPKIPPRIETHEQFDLVKEKVNLNRLVEGNKDIFDAYPALYNTTVQFIWTLGIGGAYNKAADTITLNLNNDNVKESLIHEIQHAIQHIEGFAEGSSIEYWDDWTRSYKQIRQHDNKIQKLRKNTEDIFFSLTDEEKNIYREYNRESVRIKDEGALPEAFIELNDRIKEKLLGNGFSIDKFQEYSTDIGQIDRYWRSNGILESYELYKRTAGEVEARNAANRGGFTAAMRNETLLRETEDVAREDQIIIREGLMAAQSLDEISNTLFQTAYHGSPFKFDRFDLSHIGKGEGAQAYGWGQYFAGKREIADWYRKTLKRQHLTYEYKGEQYVETTIGNDQMFVSTKTNEAIDVYSPVFDVFQELSFYGNDKEHIRMVLESRIEHGSSLKKEKYQEQLRVLDEITLDEGQLYEVDIPGDEEMLDWDKPLKEMPEQVQKTIIKNGNKIFDFNKAGMTENVMPFRTGEQIYHELSKKMGSPKMASEYLNSLGVMGIRYLDGDSRLLGEGTYNYVIFSDNDIDITQTFFQLDDELVEEAAGYESWQEFRDAYGENNNQADNAWFRSLWNDAQKIHGDTLFQEEEKTSRAQELDDRFYKEADKEYRNEVLKELYRIHNDQTLEPAKEEGEAARKEYRRVKRLQRRIETELPNAGSVIGFAAMANSGRLTKAKDDRLKTFMRKNKRGFRSVFADIMSQEEYLEDLAEKKDGEPAGRLADPRPDKFDEKARLKEIASVIKETDPALARGIEDGTVSYDDPRVAAFEAGAEEEYKKAKAVLDALEKETAEDYARLANDAQRQIVTAHEKMIKAREQMDSTNDKARRRMDEEGEIAQPYLNRQRLEKASYDQAVKAYDDLVNFYGKDAEVREAIARQEALAGERARQKGIIRRQNAVSIFKEIRKRLVKRITRNISFDNVAYDQAVLAKAIQRIFYNISYDGINKWIGPADRDILQVVWSQWSTDEEFRNTLLEQIKQRGNGDVQIKKIVPILNKESYNEINDNEKRTLHRLLPKTNFIYELGLKKLIRENKESVQLDIEEHIGDDGRAYLVLGDDLKRRVIDALGEELHNRMVNKPFNEWSVMEAIQLAQAIDGLVVEGKNKEAARKEAKRVLAEKYRNEVLEALEALEPKYVINDDDTPEEKKRKKNKQKKILEKYARGKKNNLFNNFFDANLRRFTTAMDGGRKGIFTNLLYWGENDAYNAEQRQIAARRLLIDTVMEKNHITLNELYREVGYTNFKDEKIDLYRVPGGKVTVDDLLYILRGKENIETYRAIAFGNLCNEEERQRSFESREAAAAFRVTGESRMEDIVKFAEEFFAKEENKKFLNLLNVIGGDYDRNGERLNRACIDMFNKPMWRVDNYVPMNRREATGAENENRVIEDLLGVTGVGKKWVNRGSTFKRKKIKLGGNKPIELGLYKTWDKSVTATEHLMAYGPLVQNLNAVFKGFHAGEVKQKLHDRWGKAAVDRVADTIAEFANPNAARETANRQALNKIIRMLRGKTATAYLAWKLSGVLKQMATSPWPYLQEIPPAQYLKACIEVAGGAGKINDEIREKSIFMKNRDFDPMVKLIREAMENNDNAILSGIDKFNAVGMKGLEMVDWACVAPGWLAKYRSELANVAKEQEAKYQELLKKYQGNEYADVLPTQESKVNRALSEVMSDEQQDYEAVARADDAVRRMQPSSRSTDIAPLYKNKSEVMNILLQFQTALNVIWQNIRYDFPLAVKEKQVWTVVGMVTGYALAGICLGLLTDGFDDDDDEEKKARKILFYSFTQFTDAVPIIGDGVTKLAERLITGKKSYVGQQSVLPVVEKAFGGIGNAAGAFWEADPEKRRERFVKAAQNMAEAAGLYFGAPVSGVKELGRLTDIGDGDGEFNLHLQALMGRKNKREGKGK